MKGDSMKERATKWLAAGTLFGLGSYAGYVGVTWLRYGRRRLPGHAGSGESFDRFMPRYEVAEHHSIRVAAPVETTFSATVDCDLGKSAIVQAIFKGRELVFGSRANEPAGPRGFLARMKSIGWGVLSETPGREVIMGAVTKPWEANVVFRAIPADEFPGFNEPGYAKIAWTLRGDPDGSGKSIARTETRVLTTDPHSRAKFRRYWAFLSPGILLIRWAMLRQVKREAESLFRAGL